MINKFRRDNDLDRVRPETKPTPLSESRASELVMAPALETIFDLRDEVKAGNGLRNIFIDRNPNQSSLMRKLESALEIVNEMGIEDLDGCGYDFKLV